MTKQVGAGAAPPLAESLLGAWRTNCRVNAFLIGNIPDKLWSTRVPGAPLRTVRNILGHFHNARSRWLRTLGRDHGIRTPALVNLRTVTPRQLLAALRQSDAGIERLLRLGLAAGGRVPDSDGYTWRNLPLDVGHVLTYFIAHEAHHRGQILMLARALGMRLPAEVSNGLWQWTRLSKDPQA